MNFSSEIFKSLTELHSDNNSKWLYPTNQTENNLPLQFSPNISPLIIDHGPLLDKVNDAQVNIFIPSIILASVLMLIGTPGNALVCYIYYFKWNQTTSRCFIFALALFDLINNAITMPVEIAIMFLPLKFDIPIVCKFSRFLTFLMNNASSIVLVGIAIDRFRRICRTLKPNMTVKHAKIICWTGLAFSLLSSWPALILYGTKTATIPLKKNNQILVGKMCLIADDVTDSIYPSIYLLYLGLGNIVIDILLVMIYVVIGRKICKARTFNSSSDNEETNSLQKKDSSSSTRNSAQTPEVNNGQTVSFVFWRRWSRATQATRQHTNERELPVIVPSKKTRITTQPETVHGRKIRAGRTTLMLFLVTLAFILSFVPYLIIATLRSIDPKAYFRLTNAEKAVYMLFLRSYLLQSAVNPIIYSFVNKQFRVECKILIRHIFCKFLCLCKD